MRKFDLSLRSSRSSYFATFRHQLTILSKTDALDEEKWLNMLGTFRSEERFSRNAETDLVCRLLLEKKNWRRGNSGDKSPHCERAVIAHVHLTKVTPEPSRTFHCTRTRQGFM